MEFLVECRNCGTEHVKCDTVLDLDRTLEKHYQCIDMPHHYTNRGVVKSICLACLPHVSVRRVHNEEEY